MAKTSLSGAAFVQLGYGQVEPNHLSAQRNGQIYAQLPCVNTINKLENGMFVKYDYANGQVNLTGPGEWMLVFNEVKVYREYEGDQDFAMLAENYAARVYSPVGDSKGVAQARDYSNVVTPADPYEVDSTANPFSIEQFTTPKMMGDGVNSIVPRVFKTMVGDIYTTNCVNETTLSVGDILVVGANGYLAKAASESTGDEGDESTDESTEENANEMQWQVVKVYTMPDRQPGVKIMRIA